MSRACLQIHCLNSQSILSESQATISKKYATISQKFCEDNQTKEARSKANSLSTNLNLKTGSRQSFGLQPIDQKLSDLLKPIFQGSKKEFILINNLVKNWEEIAGKKYAEFCYPKSINFNKDKSQGGKLTVAVYNPAVGFFLENNAELLIERIARLYGHKAISRIIIKQEPKIVNQLQGSEIKLSETEEKKLQETISAITDHDLAQTLQKLGRQILNEKNNEQSK